MPPRAKVDEKIKSVILNKYNNTQLCELSKELNLNTKTIIIWARKLNLPRKVEKKGQTTELNCKICNKVILISASVIKKRGLNFEYSCSRQCASTKISAQALSTQAFKLAKMGKSAKEISSIMNKNVNTIRSWLNKKGFRFKTKDGQSYQSIKNKLKKNLKQCQICEFNRIIELCHIIPASKGGDLTESNTIGLCPNHHHLFDHKKLLPEEALKLKDKVQNYQDYIKKDI